MGWRGVTMACGALQLHLKLLKGIKRGLEVLKLLLQLLEMGLGVEDRWAKAQPSLLQQQEQLQGHSVEETALELAQWLVAAAAGVVAVSRLGTKIPNSPLLREVVLRLLLLLLQLPVLLQMRRL
jgi:hypothetical protein